MIGEEYRTESSATAILNDIDEIRGLFTGHFQSGWFLMVLERMSFNTIYLNDIRQLMELQSIYPSDFYRIKTGIVALEEFIAFSRRYVLPVLRDQLGISGFSRRRNPDRDRTTQVVKELFASTFPQNLQRLTELSNDLADHLELMAQEEGFTGGLNTDIIAILSLEDPRFRA